MIVGYRCHICIVYLWASVNLYFFELCLNSFQIYRIVPDTITRIYQYFEICMGCMTDVWNFIAVVCIMGICYGYIGRQLWVVHTRNVRLVKKNHLNINKPQSTHVFLEKIIYYLKWTNIITSTRKRYDVREAYFVAFSLPQAPKGRLSFILADETFVGCY